MIRECQVDVYQDMLEIVSEMTQRQDTQETDTTLARGKITVQASKLLVYIYIAPRAQFQTV